jgi:glycosyltransferase involved in cell wall biosynthesis
VTLQPRAQNGPVLAPLADAGGGVAERTIALIPGYNEADRIEAVVARTMEVLPALVVDDGSRDATAERAAAAGATVLRQEPNQGKGAALRRGFAWALESGYGAVVTLDADGQHDPAEIPRFLEARRGTGADLVIGRRDFAQMPRVRRLSNTVGARVLSWAIGQPIPDNQSGYRLLSRRMMEQVTGSTEAGFEFEVEMIAVCIREGYGLTWVPIRTIYAGEPSHIEPWRHFTSFLRVTREARRIARDPRGSARS